ncbi:TetR family transcriptional regulator [Paludibaculum fermentans]|uniref:TetR/AcrR family transcriptional regulator n=1 Tax=Paludibaculum fermentans TaxID=1473598 RepID=UPI003EB9F069
MPDRVEVKTAPKSEETRQRILSAALKLFHDRGFEAATMRDIADEAGVATGAAYYYFPSKDAIVMEFYRRSSDEMQRKIEAALDGVSGLEDRLLALIRVKWAHFAPHRRIMRALLRNGADPGYPLSPFSAQTREIRAIDIDWFRRIVIDCGLRIPKDLEPHLPDVLWFFQMGAIYFWVIDESPNQENSYRLLAIAARSIALLIRVSALPLMRPVRKAALEIVQIVKGTEV